MKTNQAPSRFRMFLTLVKKDLRMSVPTMIGAIGLFLLPAMLYCASMMYEPKDLVVPAQDRIREFSFAAAMGPVSTLFVVPVFSGIAFARERRDRSGEFLGAMPVPRGLIVRSKFLVAASLCVLPWLVGAGIILVLRAFGDQHLLEFSMLEDTGDGLSIWGMAAELTLFLFGTGWLLSSILRSEVFASVIPLGLGLALLLLFPLIASRMEEIPRQDATRWVASMYFAVFVPVGVGSFIAGTMIALRRKSP